MRVGNLVRYNDKYTSVYPNSLIGVILEVEQDDGFASSPYRVRWIDHTTSQRDWYAMDELTLLGDRNESR